MRLRNDRSARGGSVMMMFALLAFVLLALTALAIDTGFAFLTRRQMQTATSTAAVEGLRYRDELPFFADPNDALDVARRKAAAQMAGWVFDDDFNPDNGDPLQLGAGPVVDLQDGIALPGTTFKAAQTVTPGNPPVYVPKLQVNAANNPAGDMVAGTFLIPGLPPVEGADYTRNDFTPTTTSPAAFLVRMRRTGEAIDAGGAESSKGPPLAYLFGRATLLDPDVKERGIAVRATAIAQAQPALAAGKAIPNDPSTGTRGMPGVASFSIKVADWLSLTAFDSSKVSFYAATRPMVIVGDTLTPAAGTLPAKDSNQVYVPLVNDANMVAAFGYVSASADGSTLTKVTPRIAAENATASTAVFRADPNDLTIPDPNTPAVLTLIKGLMSNPDRNQFLSAPALVR